MVSAMGDADGKARGGFVLLDQNFKVSSEDLRNAADPATCVPLHTSEFA